MNSGGHNFSVLQGVEKIIEQDFFPDLPKMKAQAEYYEALDKNDLVKLRELQNRYSKRPDTGFSVSEYLAVISFLCLDMTLDNIIVPL